MRLIDADALFNWGEHKLSDATKYGNKDREQSNWSHSTLMMYEIADEIADAPTIDPVKHGDRVMKRGSGAVWWECSKCGGDQDPSYCHPYCPHCGRKLDGRE